MSDFKLCPVKRDIIIDGFNSVYYFEFGKDFSHIPEKHDFWEMVYVDSGEVIAITDGLGTSLVQGQVIFHSPGEIHAHISDNKNPNNMLVVAFTTSSKAMSFFDKKIFTLDKSEKTLLAFFIKEATNALGKISDEYNNKNPLDFSGAKKSALQLMECYLTEFLLVLLRNKEQHTLSSQSVHARTLGQNSILELVLAYLSENIYNNLKLSDVCKNFYMCKSTLCKLFSDNIGKGPMECYLKLKMDEAKKLLRTPEYSVTEVSDLLGYSSIHNFSRAFKNYFYISPAEYKNKINT